MHGLRRGGLDHVSRMDLHALYASRGDCLRRVGALIVQSRFVPSQAAIPLQDHTMESSASRRRRTPGLLAEAGGGSSFDSGGMGQAHNTCM